MRHSFTLNLLVLAFASFSLVTRASAQDCRCGGTPTAQPHKGGDGQPLKWEYEQNIVQAGEGQVPKIVCYRREIENDSASDVRDVRWEVANFFRSIIRKGNQQASCPNISGEVSDDPSNGPIHFGPETDSYDTTVFQPKKGWDQSAYLNKDAGPSEIQTAFSFDMIDQKGTPVPVRLNFSSSTKRDGKLSSLAYLVQNDSTLPIYVLVNLTASKDILGKIPIIQNKFRLDPGDKQSFDVQQEGTAVIKPGLIVVYDTDGHIGAIDTAGFYTIPGEKIEPDSSFWKSLK